MFIDHLVVIAYKMNRGRKASCLWKYPAEERVYRTDSRSGVSFASDTCRYTLVFPDNPFRVIFYGSCPIVQR